MRNTYKIKSQAEEFYYGIHPRREGDLLPYGIINIKPEREYREFLEDTDDDYILHLMRKGGDKKTWRK